MSDYVHSIGDLNLPESFPCHGYDRAACEAAIIAAINERLARAPVSPDRIVAVVHEEIALFKRFLAEKASS